MTERQPSRLDRALRVFAPVRAGEGGMVLVLALNVFLLLTAYYIIKPVREALILASAGAEMKSYASAGQAILLLGVIPLYSHLAAILPRRKLLTVILLFFAGCLVLFYGLAQIEAPLGIVFYLWVGIFNLMVVAQFWSFANDVYTADEGKRLFAIVGFGASAGAVMGSSLTHHLIEPMGVYQLLLLSAGLLVVSLFLTLAADSRRPANTPSPAPEPDTPTVEEPAADAGLKGAGGFTLVLRNRYLLLIALMMVLANLANTTGEYLLGRMVTETNDRAVPEVMRTIDQTDAQYEALVQERQDVLETRTGSFYARFFGIVNVASLLIQLFLVARIVKWFGVRWAVLILPFVALGTYVLIAVFPVLAVARWAKTAENATDYSLQNTVRNMLFLPTTREEKYKAKQAIDTFCVRIGDVSSAGLVFLGTSFWGLSTQGFAGVIAVMAAVWLLVALAIGKRFQKRKCC